MGCQNNYMSSLFVVLNSINNLKRFGFTPKSNLILAALQSFASFLLSKFSDQYREMSNIFIVLCFMLIFLNKNIFCLKITMSISVPICSVLSPPSLRCKDSHCNVHDTMTVLFYLIWFAMHCSALHYFALHYVILLDFALLCFALLDLFHPFLSYADGEGGGAENAASAAMEIGLGAGRKEKRRGEKGKRKEERGKVRMW